ncbi:MAG TPA: hypothetical protein VK426_02240 [Methanobacterium sp.]|nr:hypothetical protein [Methanobacterium sp.]
MKYVLLIVSILGLVVFASGCTSSDAINMNNTFSKGGLTFNYPSFYTEATGVDRISASQGVELLGTYEDSDADTNGDANFALLDVRKSSLDGYTVEDEYKAQRKSLTQNGFALLSDTQSTINGVKIYEFIYKTSDPTSGEEIKGTYMLFGNGKYSYSIQIQGPADQFEKYNNVTEEVKNTIKLQ